MIDCVFLLLTFFFFALALTQRLNVTEVELPVVAAGTDAEPGEYVVVELAADGSLILEGQPAEWESLGATLTARLAEAPNTTLLIATDRATPVSEVFRLMDLLSAAEIRNLRFLREPTEAPAPAGPQGT
jgi:biopolymer transport protein ExbD